MRQTVAIVLFMAFTPLNVFATDSTQFEPTIVILLPSQVSAESSLQTEIDELSDQFRKSSQIQKDMQRVKEALSTETRDDVLIALDRRLEFLESVDYYWYISSFTARHLETYAMLFGLERPLVYAIPDTSDGSIQSLAGLALEHDVQYVLNLSQIRSYVKGDEKVSEVTIQVYDAEEKEIALDESYIGDSKNRASDFACPDGSVECTIINGLSKGLGSVLEIVIGRSPTWQRYQNLEKRRSDVLLNEYFLKKPDPSIPVIIQAYGKSISTDGYFQGLLDESRTKFIAFFARENQDDAPSTTSFVVIGLLFEGIWYINQMNETLSMGNSLIEGQRESFTSLQSWGFFSDGTDTPDPDFWETNFFSRVEDVTKNPDYEKYYESIYKRLVHNNRGYVGMYKIVADALRKQKATDRNRFESQLSDSLLLPFYERMTKKGQDSFAIYDFLHSDPTFIYPESRRVILNPIAISDASGVALLRYFVLISGEDSIFEWTYFDPTVLTRDDRHFGFEVNNQLGTITEWNFSFYTLEDSAFWQTYVLSKDDEGYKYLKVVGE